VLQEIPGGLEASWVSPRGIETEEVVETLLVRVLACILLRDLIQAPTTREGVIVSNLSPTSTGLSMLHTISRRSAKRHEKKHWALPRSQVAEPHPSPPTRSRSPSRKLDRKPWACLAPPRRVAISPAPEPAALAVSEDTTSEQTLGAATTTAFWGSAQPMLGSVSALSTTVATSTRCRSQCDVSTTPADAMISPWVLPCEVECSIWRRRVSCHRVHLDGCMVDTRSRGGDQMAGCH
jgi:hypothetical protein